jgi:hypothetical protein
MKTAPNQTAFETAPDKAHLTTSIFLGTDNPRHIRAIAALLAGPKSREELDCRRAFKTTQLCALNFTQGL